ncbi:MAG: cytochrome P450, partial [Chloroflexi bacterium]
MNGNSFKMTQVSTPETLRQPVGPRGSVLFGNVAELRRDQLAFIMGMALKYGDVSVFRVGSLRIHTVFHPDGVRRVLQDNNRNYTKNSPVFRLMKGLLGNGLFLSEGEFWLKQRRLMQPIFHRQRIAGFGQTMTLTTERTVESWQPSAAGGQVLDIAHEMMRLTLDIACRSLFSLDIQAEAGPVESAINVVLEDFIFRFE